MARLPAGMEVSALLRSVQAEGGFGTVLARGEPEAGTILLVLTESGAHERAYERMPDVEGNRVWQCVRRTDPDKPLAFSDYLDRRRDQDGDLWIVELDIVRAERFIGLAPSTD